MNDQQIDTLIAYLKIDPDPPRGLRDRAGRRPLCPTGHLPAERQQEIETLARRGGRRRRRTPATARRCSTSTSTSGAYSCARCHTTGWSYGDPGVRGQGAFGWNLTGGATNAHFPTEADMIDFVSEGSVNGAGYGRSGQGSGRMPGFGAMLTDEQIQAIVEYVRSL